VIVYFFLLLVLSLLPGALLLWFFYKKDAGDAEPKTTVLLAFIMGMIAIVPAIILEYALGATREVPRIYETFIAIALVEEGIKYVVVRYWAARQKEFSELYDGVVYAVAISLGFASIENILYVIQGGVGIALIRAFFTVPMHALGAVMIGYYVAAKKYQVPGERGFLVKGLVVPIVLHGAFDYFLTADNPAWALLLFPLMATYIIITRRLFAKVHHFLHERQIQV